jgi:hypothetical protein
MNELKRILAFLPYLTLPYPQGEVRARYFMPSTKAEIIQKQLPFSEICLFLLYNQLSGKLNSF